MAKYRKKPVVIEAIQWTGNNRDEIFNFVGRDATLGDATGLTIRTLEGEHHASVGDYIIKGIKGEFYPCKPDIFAATYEAVGQPKAEEYAYKCSVCSRIIMSKKPQMVGELYCHRLPMIQKA